MRQSNLPVIGVALPIDMIEQHRDWILERQRDVEIQDFIGTDVLDGDWQAYAARANRLLDGHRGRRGIHGPFWGFSVDTPDTAVRTVVTRRLLQGIEACVAVGGSHMVVHSPETTWDFNNAPRFAKARQDRIERMHAAMRPAVARAEAEGITIVIENIEDKDPAARVALARSFDSKAVRVSLDTGHAHYAHISTGAPPVDFFVDAAGDMLAHVHLQDADGYADRHWHPGEGTVNWTALFGALGRLASNPVLVLEVAEPQSVRRGAEHLASLGLAV